MSCIQRNVQLPLHLVESDLILREVVIKSQLQKEKCEMYRTTLEMFSPKKCHLICNNRFLSKMISDKRSNENSRVYPFETHQLVTAQVGIKKRTTAREHLFGK